jgi:hypothetical protein
MLVGVQLFIGAKLVETLITKVVGYGTRIKTVPTWGGGSFSPPVGDVKPLKPNFLQFQIVFNGKRPKGPVHRRISGGYS